MKKEKVNLMTTGHSMSVLLLKLNNFIHRISLRTHMYKDAIKWCDDNNYEIVNRESFEDSHVSN